MRRLALVALLFVTGCASSPFGPPDLSQFTSSNSAKNAAVNCLNWNGTGGTLVWLQVNQEAGVIKDGGISVTRDCTVNTESKAPVKTPAAK